MFPYVHTIRQKNSYYEVFNNLQYCILTMHFSYIQPLANSNAIKIVEDHKGNAVLV